MHFRKKYLNYSVCTKIMINKINNIKKLIKIILKKRIIEKRTKNVELRERKIWILICGAYFSAQRCCQINDRVIHCIYYFLNAAQQ